MASPRMLGMFKPCVSNAQADRRKRPKAFFRQKDRVEDFERIEKKNFEALLRQKLEGNK